MRIIKEYIEGGNRVIGVTNSGHKFSGKTIEEVLRKYLLAILHIIKDNVGADLFETVVYQNYKTSSLKNLSIEQLKHIKRIFDDANDYSKTLQKNKDIEPKITDKQRKQIVRLGLYVIGNVYGKKWFWEKLKKWVKKSSLDDLTNYEAWYIIKRLEKIETRLKIIGKLNEN